MKFKRRFDIIGKSIELTKYDTKGILTMKVKIITDSNSGILQSEAKELGIFVIPMPFTIDMEEYLEEISISQEEFYQKLLVAIDSKEIKSAPQPPNELCKCDIKYSVKMVGTYAKSYYFDFHTHGVEISSTCRFRKCIDILGIVEVDRETMSELIAILEEV